MTHHRHKKMGARQHKASKCFRGFDRPRTGLRLKNHRDEGSGIMAEIHVMVTNAAQPLIPKCADGV